MSVPERCSVSNLAIQNLTALGLESASVIQATPERPVIAKSTVQATVLLRKTVFAMKMQPAPA